MNFVVQFVLVVFQYIFEEAYSVWRDVFVTININLIGVFVMIIWSDYDSILLMLLND